MVASTCRNPNCDNTVPPGSRAAHCLTPECEKDRARQRQQEFRERRRKRIEAERDERYPRRRSAFSRVSTRRLSTKPFPGAVRVSVAATESEEDEWVDSQGLPFMGVNDYIASYGTRASVANPEVFQMAESRRRALFIRSVKLDWDDETFHHYLEQAEPEPPAGRISYWVRRETAMPETTRSADMERAA